MLNLKYPHSTLHGKFDNTFKMLVTSGWANESSGNVEAPTGAFARISWNAAEVASLRDVLDTDCFPAGTGAALYPLPEPGHYLTHENERGIIWVYQYESEAERDLEYENLDEEYAVWNREEV